MLGVVAPLSLRRRMRLAESPRPWPHLPSRRSPVTAPLLLLLPVLLLLLLLVLRISRIFLRFCPAARGLPSFTPLGPFAALVAVPTLACADISPTPIPARWSCEQGRHSSRVPPDPDPDPDPDHDPNPDPDPARPWPSLKRVHSPLPSPSPAPAPSSPLDPDPNPAPAPAPAPAPLTSLPPSPAGRSEGAEYTHITCG